MTRIYFLCSIYYIKNITQEIFLLQHCNVYKKQGGTTMKKKVLVLFTLICVLMISAIPVSAAEQN